MINLDMINYVCVHTYSVCVLCVCVYVCVCVCTPAARACTRLELAHHSSATTVHNVCITSGYNNMALSRNRQT